MNRIPQYRECAGAVRESEPALRPQAPCASRERLAGGVRMNLVEKFWSRVAMIPFHECWEWNGARTSSGYGSFKFKGKRYVASRASWEIHFGQVPSGLYVCHHCDNPGCVRPDHLFIGTSSDNMLDASSKGRLHNQFVGISHCKRGHEFTAANTFVYRGKRCCRACDSLRKRLYYHSADPTLDNLCEPYATTLRASRESTDALIRKACGGRR
jgi:hypothetical protein